VQSVNIVWANECPQSRKTKKAPENYISKENPLRNEPRHIKKGKVLSHIKAKPIACKQCHGMQGDGNGAIALNMNPKPRNFTCKSTMDQISDGQLFWIIKNGSPGTSMPSYKHLSDDKVWQLIQYIRSISNS
jgi:mono/diheme cytochrome c family protein